MALELPVSSPPSLRDDEDDRLDEALQESFPASDPPAACRREVRE
jgi:hypothetical protein